MAGPLVGLKVCCTCKKSKPRSDYWKSAARKDGLDPRCKPCAMTQKAASRARHPVTPEKRREYVARYKRRHPEKIAAGDRRRALRRFGLTPAAYDLLLDQQGGVCAICRNPETGLSPRGQVKPLAVDHCHDSDQVRGLLCSGCNTAIGLMNDDTGRLQAAINYLDQNRLEVAA